jgi:hypothetical protein
MKISDLEIVKKSFHIGLEILKSHKDFHSIEEVKNIFIEKIKEANLKNGQVLWPIRVALS